MQWSFTNHHQWCSSVGYLAGLDPFPPELVLSHAAITQLALTLTPCQWQAIELAQADQQVGVHWPQVVECDPVWPHESKT